MQKKLGALRKMLLAAVIPAAIAGMTPLHTAAQENPSAIGTPIDPSYLTPQKPVAPVAPVFPKIDAPVLGQQNIVSEKDCGAPYPCRLQAIIDRGDWQAVLSALTAAMPQSEPPRVTWSGSANSHKGYVQEDAEPDRPVCKAFQVVSYMGASTGKEKVTVCRQPGGAITVK